MRSIEARRSPGIARAGGRSATTGVWLAPGGLQRVELAIDDPTCPRCVRTVEQVLRGVPGVEAVTLNPNSGLEFVDHEPGRTPVAALHGALRTAGYRSGRAETRLLAIAASDITLIKGSRRGVATAIRISRGTMRNVYQNVTRAFLYNVLGLPVALGVRSSFLGLLLWPLLAALAMSFSSATVIADAHRLKRRRPS